MKIYHPSIEGAQHGQKGLVGFADFAKKHGAIGIQPTNLMLDGLEPKEVVDILDSRGLRLDGVSAHCPFWVHTTAHTGSKTIRPFISDDVAKLSPEGIEEWAEEYLLRLMDKCADLGVKVVPMFWGVALGWEITTGYPWGFFQTDQYDLVDEGIERFVSKTLLLRDHASKLRIMLCHEIHPGTAAMCADDFLTLREACDDDRCMAVNMDPSHCWEGETWEGRMDKVGHLVFGAHVKNHTVRPGLPTRSMQADWQKRAMYFTDLATGDLNLKRYAEALIRVGYHRRYCALMGTETAPLVTEAESAFGDLDETAAKAIEYTATELCFNVAQGSFEEGMGDQS